MTLVVSVVLVHLRDLCRVVLHFDTTLLVHAWKHTCKLLQKHKAALSGSVSDCLRLHEFVDELCCTVESIFSKVILASGGAVQEFQRLVKGCKQLLACLMILLRVSPPPHTDLQYILYILHVHVRTAEF